MAREVSPAAAAARGYISGVTTGVMAAAKTAAAAAAGAQRLSEEPCLPPAYHYCRCRACGELRCWCCRWSSPAARQVEGQVSVS